MRETNNIVKTAIILFFSWLSISGCTVKDVEEVYSAFPYIELETESINLPKTKQTVQIPVSTNRKLAFKITYGGLTADWVNVELSDDCTAIVLEISENQLETSREAVITMMTPNNMVKKDLEVSQDASGEFTIKDHLLLKSHQEILANTYTKVQGALILGNVSAISTKASGTVECGDLTITVSESDIKNESIDTLTNKINLIEAKTLILAKTKVNEFPTSLIQKNDIKKAFLDFNEIGELPSNEVLKSLELTELSLSGNGLKDISSLKDCKTIDVLDISYNDIYDLSVLSTFTNKPTIVISGLPLSEGQVEVLQENLSNCILSYTELKSKSAKVPVMDLTSIDVTSHSQATLTTKVLYNNSGSIKEVGFYVGQGTDLKGMKKYVGTYSPDTQTISLDYDNIKDFSTQMIYYRSYAINEAGIGYGISGQIGNLRYSGDLCLSSVAQLSSFYNNNYLDVDGILAVGKNSGTGVVANGDVKLPNKYLYLLPSDISDISPLSKLRTVRDGIYVANTQVKDFSVLSGIQSTPVMWLNANKMFEIPSLKNIKDLKELNLSRNNISDITPILGMNELETLYLGCSETPDMETNDIGMLTGLEKMTGLKYLDLSGLPLITKQVKDLQKLLPNCTIVFNPANRAAHLPTVRIGNINIKNKSATLNATLTYNGKTSVTEYGFYIGTDLSSMTKVPVGTTISDNTEFSYELITEEVKDIYCYPYAINSLGEGIDVRYAKFNLSIQDLSKFETANCYIARNSGLYKFRADTYGEGTNKLLNLESASVVWETRNTDESISVGDIVTNVTLKDNYIHFEVPSEFTPGNAVIAVKNTSGDIVWSWHIWVADYDPYATAQTYKSGVLVMDRNLGALNTTYGDVRSFGLFYQQGRKDPFVGCGNISKKTFANTAPAGVITYQSNGSNILSIRNPQIVYGALTSTWSDEKGDYDPCPAGWKVPSSSVWTGFTTSYKTVVSYGVKYGTPASSPDAYYPLTGDTEMGVQTLRYPGTTGYLWTTESGYAYNINSCSKTSRSRYDENPVRCVSTGESRARVATVSVYDVTKTSAVVSGSMALLSSANVTELGFVYCLATTTPTTSSSKVMVVVQEGQFSHTIQGLKPATSYNVRAYVIESGKTEYGNVISFTTDMAGGNEGLPGEDYEWE